MSDERRRREARPRRFVIGRVEDFPEGTSSIVDISGRSIGVFHFGGRMSALLNRCPHQGGPLCAGVAGVLVDSHEVGTLSVDDERVLVACPWHGWEFDIHDGQSYCDPKRFRVKPYPVDVEKGSVVSEQLDRGDAGAASRQIVEGPYKAEVIPIEVEDDYVVVQLR